MKVNFAHLCDYATISREGKLSVLGIFDHMQAASVPVVHPQLYLVFEVEISSAELEQDLRLRVELRDADGAIALQVKATFRVQGQASVGERPRIPQVMPLVGVQLKKFGAHQFSIFLNDDHKADIQFEVRQGTPPAATV